MNGGNQSVTEMLGEAERIEAQREYNRWWSERVMRDEGDLSEIREPTMGESLRALIILTLISWVIVALFSAGVWRLFHHA